MLSGRRWRVSTGHATAQRNTVPRSVFRTTYFGDMTNREQIPVRHARIGDTVWAIDVSDMPDFPLVCGEHYGVRVLEQPLVVGLDLDSAGAVVYTSEAVAREAHKKCPAGLLGAGGVVRKLVYRPAGYTQFVYA